MLLSSVCEERDVKGLYKRSGAGEIKNDDLYEPPLNPTVECLTDAGNGGYCVMKVLNKLELGYCNRLLKVRAV